jgi:hypothetical protein
MTKLIPLTERPTISPKNRYAIVDDEDYEWLSQWRWFYANGYATRANKCKDNDGWSSVQMHRAILNVPQNLQVDHRDHNKLNNTRANLRLCTRQQNSAYRNKTPRPTTSQYKGVTRHRATYKWQARIGTNGKQYHLGLFLSEEEAARAYDTKARELFGPFAQLNFPEQE